MDRILFSGKFSCEKVRKTLNWSTIKCYSEIRCVAKMIYNDEEYWAVNGVKDEGKNIRALKSIIPNLDNDHICRTYKKKQKMETCYYHPVDDGNNIIWTVIKYSQYKKVLNKSKGINENERLFSCCERKLISSLNCPKDNFKMYVAFRPCYMCENAFMYLVQYNNNMGFEVHYTDISLDLETECVNHLKNLKLIK
ncbi:MAG: hypothetical protein IJJ76_05565 [Ruminococcus sp.]|uniref:hypothetical protein n=2 Tax=Ruminococcus sp. TaxID=41978 RepID=UPI0025EBB05A|nr:hypothetical protein [Ruminococcus sp.]MBR0529219.1 hypothetical protein [Ruminococcus sp.]